MQYIKVSDQIQNKRRPSRSICALFWYLILAPARWSIKLAWYYPKMTLVMLCWAWMSATATLNPFEWTAKCNPVNLIGCPPRGLELSSPDFRLLANVQSQFKGAIEQSSTASITAMNLKHSEVAIRDLAQLVDMNSLPGKASLVRGLDEFLGEARAAGRQLQKFSSRAISTVDQIIAINERTVEMLEGVSGDSALRLSESELQTWKREATKLWFAWAGTMKSSVSHLIVEAMANMRALDNLNDRLVTIEGMRLRANQNVQASRDSLNPFWVFFGGYKNEITQYNSQAYILGQLRVYRKDAADYIATALFQLQQIELELTRLNEQMGTALLGDASKVPLSLSIKAIKKGSKELLDGKARARAKEIANIQKKRAN